MERSGIRVGPVLLLVLVVAIVLTGLNLLLDSPLKAEPPVEPPKEGTPVAFQRIEEKVVENGENHVVVQVGYENILPAVFTTWDGTDCFHDDKPYFGWRGTWSSQVWVRLKPGYGPSVNPHQVGNPALPAAFAKLEAFRSAYPDVELLPFDPVEGPIHVEWGKRDASGNWFLPVNNPAIPGQYGAPVVLGYGPRCDYDRRQPEGAVVRIFTKVRMSRTTYETSWNQGEYILPLVCDVYFYQVREQ